jgi:hypothetical protein
VRGGVLLQSHLIFVRLDRLRQLTFMFGQEPGKVSLCPYDGGSPPSTY